MMGALVVKSLKYLPLVLIIEVANWHGNKQIALKRDLFTILYSSFLFAVNMKVTGTVFIFKFLFLLYYLQVWRMSILATECWQKFSKLY